MKGSNWKCSTTSRLTWQVTSAIFKLQLKAVDQTFSSAALIIRYIQSLVTKSTWHKPTTSSTALPWRCCCRFFSSSRSSCYNISSCRQTKKRKKTDQKAPKGHQSETQELREVTVTHSFLNKKCSHSQLALEDKSRGLEKKSKPVCRLENITGSSVWNLYALLWQCWGVRSIWPHQLPRNLRYCLPKSTQQCCSHISCWFYYD